ERQARLEAEAEARQAAERAAREREARLQEEREAVEREARLAAERGAAERNAGEREAGLREARAEARAGSRELHVPPGHHPPEGECRIWYEDRPPGRQPAAAPCEELLDGAIDPGVFILYGGESWDGSHDWEAAELAHPGAVPRPVLALSRIVGGDGTSGDESESIGSSGGIEDPRPTASSGPPEDRPGRGRSGSSPAPR
ncbi:MAG: hypothetical protein R3223_05895, partial [Longimicrobiales bacterium]|nr:hypothetical protein [Longimicrobiales bacterium]